MPEIKIRRDEFAAEYLTREIRDDAGFGTFVAWHRRMDIGKINHPNHESFLQSLPENSLRIPVYIYEHGSSTLLSVTPFICPWDSGQVGIWAFTPEELLNFGQGEEAETKALESVRELISYMNDIYSCNVWSFEIEDFDGEAAEFVGGFVGNGAIDQMKSFMPDNLHRDLMLAWERRS